MQLETLYKISYGMYVIGSSAEGKLNGQIANTVFQVTSDPATVAVSINRKNLTHQYISAGKKFSVSILAQTAPMEFIGRFGFKSGREINKFEGIKYKTGVGGQPITLDHTLGFLEAEVVNQLEMGTHTVFVGKITAAEVLSAGEPMTYAYYHAVKGGKSPQNAPTYQAAVSVPAAAKLGGAKYVCKVCGFVYDPAVGDPDGGVAVGTPFEEIPDSWVCPVCGADKSQFEVQA